MKDYNKILKLHLLGKTNVEIAVFLGVTPAHAGRRVRALGLIANGRRAKILKIKGNKAKCSSCGKWKVLLSSFEKTKSGGFLSSCYQCRYLHDTHRYNENEGLYLRVRYVKLKSQSLAQKIPFNISFKEISDILKWQRGKCFYTGLPLKLKISKIFGHDSLSFDKVVPELGYVTGNVVLTTRKINAVKSNLSINELKMWIPSFYRKIIKAPFLNVNF